MYSTSHSKFQTLLPRATKYTATSSCKAGMSSNSRFQTKATTRHTIFSFATDINGSHRARWFRLTAAKKYSCHGYRSKHWSQLFWTLHCLIQPNLYMGLIGPVTFAVGLIRRSHQCLHNHQWCWRNRQPTWIQETIEKIKCFFCPCRLPLLNTWKVVAPAIDEHEIFLQFLSPATTTSNRASDSAAVEQRLIFCLGCRDS